MTRSSASDYSEFFERHVAKLIEAGIARADEFMGCAPAEIEECGRAQGVTRLPAVYTAFLSAMGKAAGAFLRSSDVYSTYPDILEAKHFAIKCLTPAGNPAVITESVFVFSHYLGHQFVL